MSETSQADPDRARVVQVRARLDEPLSRWLWLVKWLLLIPHFVVLVLLWMALAVVTVVAFFAILITGRYPQALFTFVLGVLRWSWRVWYYGYSALGTDQYPPFTLGPVPDYPATLDVAYPGELSRGLVLVKWWLLAIPHYLVLAFVTAGTVWGQGTDDTENWPGGGGLISVLVLFAAIALLFGYPYPRGLYDFILGLNRWALRVAAYVLLLTDEYPPFRLDQGPGEPGDPAAPSAARTDAAAEPPGAEPEAAPPAVPPQE